MKTNVIFLILVITGIGLCQFKIKPPKIKQPDLNAAVEVKNDNKTINNTMQIAPRDTLLLEKKQIDARTASDGINAPRKYIADVVPGTIVIPTIDFNEQAITSALRLLSAPYGINISVSPEVSKTVTLRLNKIKLADALEFLIKQNGFDYSINNNIISVFKPVVKEPEVPKPIQTFAVEDGKLTVDIKNVEVDSVVRWCAERGKINLIPEKGLNTKLTSFFSDLPTLVGLKVIFDNHNIKMVEKEGLYYLVSTANDGHSKEQVDSRVKHFVEVKDGNVSFNLTNARLVTLIRDIADKAGLDIYLYGQFTGDVTAKLTNMPIDAVFESILRDTEYTFWKSQGIYYFGQRKLYEKQVTDIIRLNYLPADEVLTLLPNSIKTKASIKTVKEYNALLLEAPSTDIIEAARDFIITLDKPIAQILIEAWVVELERDKIRKFDIKAGSHIPKQEGASYFPSVSVGADRDGIVNFIENFVDVGSTVKSIIPQNFALQLDMLEQEGLSNLISKPQIATLNGHSATITFGTTEYYLLEKEVIVTDNNNKPYPVKDQRYEKINVDMTLTVTPWVSGNDEVTMEIKPSFDVPGVSPAANIPPPVNRRTLNSTVRVKNGEMIILGGVINETEKEIYKKVPFFGSIPFIGRLFSGHDKKKSKSQLMIYLIPHVYYGSEMSVSPNAIEKELRKPDLVK